MAQRICTDDEAEADEFKETLALAGFAAEVTRERLAGDDDDESVQFVVQTDAEAELVAELIEDSQAWLEVSDPMTGTSATVNTDALPDRPRR